MKVEIHAPSAHVILISAALALLALICYLFFIPYLTPVAHWIALIAYGVLGLATIIRV